MSKLIGLSDAGQTKIEVERAAHKLGWQLEWAEPQTDVIAYLVLHQPLLTVLDLEIKSIDWQTWVLQAKTSPATRKQPILAIAPELALGLLAQAKQRGCDGVLSAEAFYADSIGVLQQWARHDDQAELLRQAALPLPPLAQEGVAQFNAKAYYEQHESFEHAWRAEPGPVRQLYQGILQVGVAYYQIQRKNYVGARKMFMRAWQYLNVLPAVCQGVDVAQLRRDAQTAQAMLENLGPERMGEFDMRLLQPVSYEP